MLKNTRIIGPPVNADKRRLNARDLSVFVCVYRRLIAFFQQPAAFLHLNRAQRAARVAACALLALLAVVAALAQTETQIESDEVKRVGVHITCQCGCTDDVNCNMSSGQCHFCKPARTKIFAMQKAGMSDSSIVASFVKQYGASILRRDPNSFFWVIPYAALALGLIIIGFVVRRWTRRPKPVTAAGPAVEDDPTYARYRDAVEKDTARLD
ncbi:MAG TPA: cytochrome c-type biogenesis protein CcmH [Bryobacteraceae bacterium]|nr:cytochrome c-type biogenesis protein CcmH [Bryobacteraceae bacterium]